MRTRSCWTSASSAREGERARIHTRIIMGPVFAKALLRTLRESLTHYQETYGPIEDDGGLPTDDASVT